MTVSHGNILDISNHNSVPFLLFLLFFAVSMNLV